MESKKKKEKKETNKKTPKLIDIENRLVVARVAMGEKWVKEIKKKKKQLKVE